MYPTEMLVYTCRGENHAVHCVRPRNRAWKNVNALELGQGPDIWYICTVKQYLAFKKNDDLQVKV